MSYDGEPELAPKAKQQFEKLPKEIRQRIYERILRLSNNPFVGDIEYLGLYLGFRAYRCRVGKYRIFFYVNEEAKRIVVYKIDKRSRVYDRP